MTTIPAFFFSQRSEISFPTPRKGFPPHFVKKGETEKNKNPRIHPRRQVIMFCRMHACVCVPYGWMPLSEGRIPLLVLAAQSKGPGHTIALHPTFCQEASRSLAGHSRVFLIRARSPSWCGGCQRSRQCYVLGSWNTPLSKRLSFKFRWSG